MENPLKSDKELAESAQGASEGDYGAFEQLVLRYQKKVIANCRHLTRDPGCAEDLAQEVFVKAYFGLPRYESRSSFRTWLQRIKINHCFNYLKKQRGKVFVDVEDESVMSASELSLQPDAEKAAIARSERKQIAATLDAMSDNLRLPLLLRDMDQLSYEEVAAVLGISLAAVKMRIKRGREEFRRRFQDLNGGTFPPHRAMRHQA